MNLSKTSSRVYEFLQRSLFIKSDFRTNASFIRDFRFFIYKNISWIFFRRFLFQLLKENRYFPCFIRNPNKSLEASLQTIGCRATWVLPWLTLVWGFLGRIVGNFAIRSSSILRILYPNMSTVSFGIPHWHWRSES